MLKEKLEQRKCFPTAWGKLITEEEAYRQLNRQIAAMTANLFQVMRIFEPSWEKRTEAICGIANMMNMAGAGTPEEQKDYVNASLYEAFNIPELCEKSSWLGGITGDSGDEWENMAGRVVQFTRNRVEKELDTCPWDIVGSELCNMTTSMFTANFDLASSNGTENEVALNMCQARGCGNKHCRVVAERRDVYNLPKQGWLDHMQQPVDPIHDTPRERMVKEGQCLRNGQYTQNFGEETSLEKAYHWVAQMGWVWSIQFPMMAIKDMAPDEDEFLRVFRIVFATAARTSSSIPLPKRVCAATSACRTRWTRTTAGSSADISAICSTCSRCRMRWCAGRRTRHGSKSNRRTSPRATKWPRLTSWSMPTRRSGTVRPRRWSARNGPASLKTATRKTCTSRSSARKTCGCCKEVPNDVIQRR